MKWSLECVQLGQILFHLIIQVRIQPQDLVISDIATLEARALAEALRSVLFELLKYQMEINKVNELKKIARASISDGQAREQKLNNARLGKLSPNWFDPMSEMFYGRLNFRSVPSTSRKPKQSIVEFPDRKQAKTCF